MPLPSPSITPKKGYSSTYDGDQDLDNFDEGANDVADFLADSLNKTWNPGTGLDESITEQLAALDTAEYQRLDKFSQRVSAILDEVNDSPSSCRPSMLYTIISAVRIGMQHSHVPFPSEDLIHEPAGGFIENDDFDGGRALLQSHSGQLPNIYNSVRDANIPTADSAGTRNVHDPPIIPKKDLLSVNPNRDAEFVMKLVPTYYAALIQSKPPEDNDAQYREHASNITKILFRSYGVPGLRVLRTVIAKYNDLVDAEQEDEYEKVYQASTVSASQRQKRLLEMCARAMQSEASSNVGSSSEVTQACFFIKQWEFYCEYRDWIQLWDAKDPETIELLSPHHQKGHRVSSTVYEFIKKTSGLQSGARLKDMIRRARTSWVLISHLGWTIIFMLPPKSKWKISRMGPGRLTMFIKTFRDVCRPMFIELTGIGGSLYHYIATRAAFPAIQLDRVRSLEDLRTRFIEAEYKIDDYPDDWPSGEDSDGDVDGELGDGDNNDQVSTTEGSAVVESEGES